MPPVLVSPELDDMSAAASFSVCTTETKPVLESGSPCPPRRTVSRRRSVDFVKPSAVVEIEKLNEEDRDQIWYSRDEYDIIKARNSLIVKMMKKGSFVENDEHSFRGLEHKLKEGFKQRRDNKFNALNCVLVSAQS